MSSLTRCLLTALVLCACEPVKSPSSDDAAPPPDDASTAAENCFDGLDDDESGAADCADLTCALDAVCVPVPDSGQAGVVIPPDQDCPAGFTGGETVVFRGPQADPCEGCSCTPGTTTCNPQLFWYSSDTSCVADTTLTGGASAPVTEMEPNCPNPFTSGNTYGTRAVITPTSQTCSKSGTATPPEPRWAESWKFCRASAVGTGCAAGSACVPRRASEAQCVLAAENTTCTGFATSASDWATSYSDTRVCGACGCTASGGGCDNVKIGVGSDYSCNDQAIVGNGQKVCGYSYSPPVRVLGAPTPPTSCDAAAAQTGTVEGRTPQTLCCGI